MKKFVRDKFRRFMTNPVCGFSYFRSDFAGKFVELQRAGYLQENGPSEMIWQTRSKFVLKVPAGDGKFVVYKSYRKISKPYKYMLRLSPCAAEALNYQLMQDCALPMATLLAVGEERKFFLLRNAFIVTEFADGFRDGRDFMPDGAMKDRNDLANEFILRNLALLARCHDCGILHRGFTPANLLYKIRQTPDENGHWLDLIWIDVASCRKRFPVQINHSLREELNRFFHFFSFTPEEMDNYIKYYLQARKNHRPASKYLKNFY